MGDSSEINKLTDDYLIQIFQRLATIADKLRVERVCKKWKNVSQRSWSNFKYLDFSLRTWGIQENVFLGASIRSIDLDKIIRLSGRFLTSISTDVEKFARIYHLLPIIRELQLRDDCVSQKGIYPCKGQCTYDAWKVICLVTRGEIVTNFKIKIEHSHYKKEDFARFLRKMKELKCFHLDVFEVINWCGTFLLDLSFEPIEEIVLNDINWLCFDHSLVSMMIKKFKKKLHTLGLELCNAAKDGVLKALPSQANTLKNLKLRSSCSVRSQPSLLSTVPALTHSEQLDFRGCLFYTDAVLEVVGKNCKNLTYLNLSGSIQITDRRISSICYLNKLTYLSINALESIGNPPLEKLANLVVLDVSFTLYTEEECLCSFLEKAHKLRALDASHCSLVTNKLLNIAIVVVKTRNTDNAFDLYFYATGINSDVVVEKPLLLNIVSFGVIQTKYVKYDIKDPYVENHIRLK